MEAAYQAAKHLVPEFRKQIREAPRPGQAKRLGQKLGTPRADWEDIKIPVMQYLVRQKFFLDVDLGDALARTGDAYIEEGNTWGDFVWGVDLETGEGRNELGHILMRVRAEYRTARLFNLDPEEVLDTHPSPCSLEGPAPERSLFD